MAVECGASKGHAEHKDVVLYFARALWVHLRSRTKKKGWSGRERVSTPALDKASAKEKEKQEGSNCEEHTKKTKTKERRGESGGRKKGAYVSEGFG